MFESLLRPLLLPREKSRMPAQGGRMISRLVVPKDAQVGENAIQMQSTARKTHLVARQLIPADACIAENVPNMPSSVRKTQLLPHGLVPGDARLRPILEAPSPNGNKAGRMMVRRLLVPEGARTGIAIESRTPSGRGTRRLFGDALLSEAALTHRRSATDWLISFGIHAALVAGLLILPFFVTQAIDPYKLEVTYLVAPHSAPTPPPPALAAAPHPVSKRSLPVTAKLTMPIAVPKVIPKVANDEATVAPPEVVANDPGGDVGGPPGGQIGGIFGGILGGTAVAPPASLPVAATAATSKLLRVGGEVKAPRQMYAPTPQYPIWAQREMIQGVVEIDAIIDENGHVIEERAISGPGPLIAAAIEAVKHWKYEPTYLNGVPCAIGLTVKVVFSSSPKSKIAQVLLVN